MGTQAPQVGVEAMDDSQVGKWQALVSPVYLPPEAGVAEARIKVSTLRSLGSIEPDGRELPNGCAGLCASLDALSRKGEDGQMEVCCWLGALTLPSPGGRGERRVGALGEEAPVENCGPAGGVLSR